METLTAYQRISALYPLKYPHVQENALAILLASLAFLVLSWTVYYGVAPRLITRYYRKMYQRQGGRRSSGEFLRYGSMRLKWAHMIVSLVHALVVTGVTAWFIWIDVDGLSADRIDGYSPNVARLLAFSAGYFLWDACVCFHYYDVYGPGFTIHALMAFLGILALLKPCMIFYGYRFLVFEVSTIFVDLHWILEKLGFIQTPLQLVNDLLALVGYLVVRFGFGFYNSFLVLKDLWIGGRAQFSVRFICGAILLNVITHSLNIFWFYKLGRAAIRSMPSVFGLGKGRKTIINGRRSSSVSSVAAPSQSVPPPQQPTPLRKHHFH